jgi:hypothetical protein
VCRRLLTTNTAQLLAGTFGRHHVVRFHRSARCTLLRTFDQLSTSLDRVVRALCTTRSDPAGNPRPLAHRAPTDHTHAQIFESLNHNSRQKGRQLNYQSTLYGYRRVDPIVGVHYILDVILMFRKFRGRRASLPVRRHAYAMQAFQRPQIIEDEEWRRFIGAHNVDYGREMVGLCYVQFGCIVCLHCRCT